ncbi:hypothetical protein [Arthrobacter sp. zg-Y179]|uniref:hypothetical protein n=1 Tax=Arthrobacter sp. zg-Y179 TaxID=2894188 RepID=UPI001E41AED5|nr:hypothetical protein [Arthrobacter sp. zg-Y179]MCC9175625.1 hypothetical protein [Arthrobacter sp. zg-Y179]
MSEQVPQGTNNANINNAYAYPGGPGVPAGPAAAAVEPPRPKDVNSSFGLLMFALALTVVNIPIQIAILNSDDSRAAMQAEYDAAGLVVDMDAAVLTGSIVLVVLGILCIAINLVTAIFIRKGHGWARIVLTVYAGLTLVSLFTGTNLMGWWGVMALLIATFPLYRKAAATWFTQMSQYRQHKKLNQAY